MTQSGLFPISVERHFCRSWNRFETYIFAKHITECDLVSSEIPNVAATFPIAFRKTKNGVKPVAVFSTLDGGKNPFVSEAGHWRAQYVPSIFRCHPFSAEPVKDAAGATSDAFTLMVNESTGFVCSNESGTPFFSNDRQLSPELLDVYRFFQNFLGQKKAALRACRLMTKLMLFAPLNGYEKVELPKDVLGVDISRLGRLSPAENALLLSSGAMQLIFAHQVSLSHIEWLQKVQDRVSNTSFARQQTPNNPIDSFLSAVATAQSYAEQEAAHAYF